MGFTIAEWQNMICRTRLLHIMEDINIITPPDVEPSGTKRSFWKQLGMLVLGTTISLVLTFGTAQIIDKNQRAKDRRLSALMVMSNIESFAQKLDNLYNMMDEVDTAATWLLDRPIELLEKMPEKELRTIVTTAYIREALTYDKSTENIFSNNIDTWKNMGNYQFIDNVGNTFTVMHFSEDYWNDMIREMQATMKEVSNRYAQNPDNTNFYVYWLKDPTVRRQLQRLHQYRSWLRNTATELRYDNRKNMAAIGIDEQAVMEFLKERQKEIEADVEEPDYEALNVPRPDREQLTTYRKYDSILYSGIKQ